jgi:muconate cycloisomerase
VRAAIGPKVKLGVDANGGWALETAERTIQQLRAEGIYFVEQPLPPEELTAMAELRRRIGLPVIADESVGTMQDAHAVALAGAADVFSIYVGKAGGIGPAVKIARFAAGAGIKCTIGSNLELGVGSAAMVHLALATAGVAAEDYACDIIGPFFYEDDIVREPLPILPGCARANERPGLGVELDEEKVRKYRVNS